MHQTSEGPEMDQRPNNNNTWKFSRTLSLDSLLAVGAAAFAVIFFGTTLDKRLSLMESKYEELTKIIERNETNSKERSQRIEAEIKDQGRQIQQMVQPRR